MKTILKPVTPQLALEVLKEVYSQGDSYQSGENKQYAWASFSNDYPLQHGPGWMLKLHKGSSASIILFETSKEGRIYRESIKKAIQKHCTKKENIFTRIFNLIHNTPQEGGTR